LLLLLRRLLRLPELLPVQVLLPVQLQVQVLLPELLRERLPEQHRLLFPLQRLPGKQYHSL
jgi:hypothetical protein